MDARRTALVLAASLALFVLYGAWPGDPRPLAFAGDAHYVLLTAQSLAFDFDLDLTNQYAAHGDPFGLGLHPAKDGWRFPPREIGPSVLMVPGLWLHAWLGAGPQWLAAFACAPAACCLAALWAVTRRLTTAWTGTADPLAASAATFGFVVPFYALGAAGYAHAPDAVVCGCLLLALVRDEAPTRTGAWLAVAVLFRLQNLLWLGWPALFILVSERRQSRLRAFAVIFGVGLLGLLPQAVLAVLHPGSETGAIRWTTAFFDVDDYAGDVWRVFFSVDGLVLSTPVVLLALAGALAGLTGPRGTADRHRLWAGVLVFAALALLIAATRDPLGGWSFGGRRFAGCAGLFACWVAVGRARARAAIHRGWSRHAVDVALWLTVAGNLVVTALALSGRLDLYGQS